MPEWTPEAQQKRDRYLLQLKSALQRMPEADREHMAEHVQAQIDQILQKHQQPISVDDLNQVLESIGEPIEAADIIQAQHRCSWCNQVLASVEPFEFTLKGQPLALRAESPAHQQKLKRYVSFADKTLTLWFRLLFIEILAGVIITAMGVTIRNLNLLLTGIAFITIAPGATFILFPFLTVRGIGRAPQRFNEALTALGARYSIQVARLLGLLLIFLGGYTIRELSQSPPW